MGRGSYLGGGTLIFVGRDTSTYSLKTPSVRSKDGKRFKGSEGIKSASKTSPPKRGESRRLREQKREALLAIIRAEVRRKTIILPAKLSHLIHDKIQQAGGSLQWARRQKDYSVVKAELEAYRKKKPARNFAVEHKGLSIPVDELSSERFLALRSRGWKIKGDQLYAPKEDFATAAATVAPNPKPPSPTRSSYFKPMRWRRRPTP